MLKVDGHEAAYSLLLVGGHAVAAALIDRQPKLAIYESLGVVVCVVIFFGVQELITYRLKGESKGDARTKEE